jgi:phosphate transport system protein
MALTRHHFDEELEALKNDLLLMGTATEEMVRDAVSALTEQDMTLADAVVERDDAVDRMDLDIESRCLRLLALQQPMASDLRVIGTALKVITDIERIGDHAVDISKVARRLGQEAVYKPLVDIPRLGEMARAMIHDALDAFVRHDLDTVEKVIDADDAVDALYARMRTDLQGCMKDDPSCVLQASYLLFVAHYLERICDHCTNVVERVEFMETGRVRDIHAPGERADHPASPPDLRLTA